MAMVEVVIPMTMGSNPMPSVEPASSAVTEATVPRIIELRAPAVLAFFHHTAEIYAGTKAEPNTEVANTTMSNTPGGSVIARIVATTARIMIVSRETLTEVRSVMSRWMKRAQRS